MSEPRTDAKICGMGHSMKRKEDPRFIRGQGRYIDDFVLPGMLYMDIVRSPHAHAKIKKINTEKALKIPGVLAVIDGPTLAKYKLHWMPTISADTQMVLPIDEVMYQAQEVCAVIATERYIAADGVDAVEVEYEPLPVMVDPHKSLAPGAPVLRKDKEGKKDNLAFHWQAGDKADAERALAASDVVASENVYLPRIHVASMETCGCIADFDTAQGKLTVYMTTQAPHAVRTVLALVAGHVGLSEERIRVVSPDIGGGFGGKVPVYPGYVVAIAASVVIGKPVKWIEDRMENLQADSFARDYHMKVELGAKRDGTMTSLKIKTVADHGYANASANPSKFPAGLFSICTGSYDLKHAFCEVDAAYTHKPPGGVAYRCSFRVTEAVHAIERATDALAQKLNMDPAELRMKNFIRPEQFPYKSVLGWEYDSGNYGAALKKAMGIIGYDALRKEQAEKRKKGELMGIGICSFTEELGIPAAHVQVEEGDTDTAPYGLGTYASRSTPTSGAACALAARKIRDKAKKIAAHLLEVSEQDLEWEPGKFFVKGAPQMAKTIQECAFAAYTNHPQGMEAGLEAVHYYDPPNLTFPFGSYICVVDIDRGTGDVKVRRFVAVDDCGNIINPMIVDGQIHGGLTQGIGPALYEEISYDDEGNVSGGSFLDYYVPTALETPHWETDKTTTPSPHHPFGAKGVGESATVGAPPAIANAVVDALRHLGVTHLDIPITPEKVWTILKNKGVAE